MKITNRIDEIVKDLNNGKVVCFKTDTIWGLSANPYDKNALEKLYKLKHRDFSKPFIFLIKDEENIESFVNKLPDMQEDLTKKVWPGPISVVFDFNKNNDILNFYSNKETIALRKPKNKICQKILSKLNYPLPSTSVNIEGNAPLNYFEEIKEFLKDEDVTILNQKNYNKKEIASTLIKLENNTIKVLRKGKLPKKILDLLKI